MLNGFGMVFNALGICVKPYLTQIVSTILWWLNNKSAKCGEVQLLSTLGLVLFEQLGKEYRDTLDESAGQGSL
ncbi:hypothetical protein AZE42_09902 [Rhizopogon vesiculosus]|uniref:Uncharacterized protein n=1 Tax=Rhizopogon vesiculosus TaxID=180088 RepID=A0A1J8QRA7_9AGAM|nr:hypothetical protein AZE42_09902 [Rhizopogon vesiculosus]